MGAPALLSRLPAPLVLGFSHAKPPRLGTPKVCWAHATESCLFRLGLPLLSAYEVRLNLVVCPEVSPELREAVADSISRASSSKGARPSRPIERLRLTPWRYPQADAWPRGGATPFYSCSPADLQRMNADSEGPASCS